MTWSCGQLASDIPSTVIGVDECCQSQHCLSLHAPVPFLNKHVALSNFWSLSLSWPDCHLSASRFVMAPVFSLADVQSHNTKDDLYLIIRGKVYNASSFVDDHPCVFLCSYRLHHLFLQAVTDVYPTAAVQISCLRSLGKMPPKPTMIPATLKRPTRSWRIS